MSKLALNTNSKHEWILSNYGRTLMTFKECPDDIQDAINQYRDACELDDLIDLTRFEEIDFQIDKAFQKYMKLINYSVELDELSAVDFKNISEHLTCGSDKVQQFLQKHYL